MTLQEKWESLKKRAEASKVRYRTTGEPDWPTPWQSPWVDVTIDEPLTEALIERVTKVIEGTENDPRTAKRLSGEA